MTKEDKKNAIKRAVNEKPLCHPGISSVAHHDFDVLFPPEHLRKLYGKIYRAVTDKPEAPKHIQYLGPREHGKSEAATVVVPSWLALRNSNYRIAIISRSSTLAKKKLSQCEDTISQYKEAYGRRIHENKATRLTLYRSHSYSEGTIEAFGIDSSITGGHYDVIIFDDILEWENQRTETQRDKVEEQFQDFMNLGSKGETTYIMIGTRKHPKDLYGKIINNPKWDTTIDKAISDWSMIENQEYSLKIQNSKSGEKYWIGADELGEVNGRFETVVDVDVERDVEVLWEDWWPIEDLISNMISTQLDDEGSMLVWQRENQQDVQVMQGQVLSLDMLSYVSELPKDNSAYSWYAGLDPAIEDDPEKAAANDTDYWALSVVAWDHMEDRGYLENCWRTRGLSLTQGVTWVKNKLDLYPTSKIKVESNHAQRWFVQTAEDRGLKVDKTTTTEDKESRIINVSSRFETDKVRIVAEDGEASKWQHFEEEWVEFPTGDHDDMIDSAEIALQGTESTTMSESKHDLGSVF